MAALPASDVNKSVLIDECLYLPSLVSKNRSLAVIKWRQYESPNITSFATVATGCRAKIYQQNNQGNEPNGL
jgi:hypothetical protein